MIRFARALCSFAFLVAASAAGCSDRASTDAPSSGGEAEPIGETHQAVTSAQACVTVRRSGGSGAVFDAQIGGPAPATTQNFGSSQNMNAGVFGAQQRQILLQFDVSSIPQGPNTNIVNANAVLAQGQTGNTGPETINVHRVTSPWSESTVTWQSFGGAFLPAVATTFTNASLFPSINMNALVTGWVRGTFPNDGVLLESATNITNFWASENPSVNSRPSLNVCFTVTCNPGFADCNNSGLDGCEVDTTTSAANCGGCGNACALPNAAPSCVGSACAIGACNLGFADCNHVAADGCETLLTTNANCGGCGVACALPNAASSCASGTCTLTSCTAGHYDCDGNPSNGCEATPCVNGSHCAGGAGCTSGVCANGFCAAPACNDGLKNGSETAVDCGGGSCPPCAVGLTCNAGSDCTTGVCNGGVCAGVSCTDGVKNGAETAVDCGGGACPACAAGKGCQVGADCTTGVCTAGVCQAPSCNDGLKNGSETAVDCGGGACPACAAGKHCNLGADCIDLVCTGNVCQIASCSDGVQNGTETDVDCGGTCAPCNTAAKCHTNADCGSSVCVSGFCQAPSCSDGVKNGNETGIDCGGSCFKPEVCNGIDDDCNGLIDDGLGSTTCGVGACQTTVQNCVSGKVQTCVPGSPLPADLCDGLDENCDGVVNGGCACTNGKTQSCYTAAPGTLGVGVCQSGTQTCAHGQWGACAGEVTPTVETCDGLDNDCNGLVDDGLGQTVCGVGGCQVTTPNCLNGMPQTCAPRPPQPEICDGIDNDCNGLVDDLPAITCGVGACQNTVAACVNGQANTCTPGAPSAEICDGLDNDCDGVIDNGNPGGNQACSSGKLGVCGAGTTACTNGALACNQNVQPSAETCNGLDDDCDGVVDNGNPGGNAACSTGKLGICAAGTTVCSSGQLACNQTSQPHAETCNGLDDDCDGVVDNGNPGGNQACSTGKLGVCSAGTTACTGGSIACNQNVQPSAEVCDGALDENCNGVVDEGCNCVNGHTQPCYTGPAGTQGVGACHQGTQTCVAGSYGACVGQVLPSTETCDGVDNDCNGQVDEGLGTVSCGVGQCAVTVPFCSNGQVNTCVPGAPTAETCDGLDNDCDGVVDNGNPGGNLGCNTGHLGVCSAGTTACTNGAIACNQNVQPHAETCNGLDDDCDGVVDNGNPGGNAACSTGHLGVCAAGTTVCSGGQLACTQNVQPHAETCNGLDDDCDGMVDNGNPGGNQACSTGKLGVCSAGTTACTGGSIACNQNVQPSAQLCNGLDENCNGVVDEGCNCLNGSTQPCYGGAVGTQNVGVCHGGTQTCVSGNFGACVGQVLPSAETCDGLDNDCNGQVDDGLGTVSCGVGQCAATVPFCSNGQVNTCVPGAPSPEVCDGLDNDCDGVVDNGNPGSNAACNTGNLGVCAAGLTTCQGGAIACIQQHAPSPEVCDGLDNDCDGAVDNGNPGGNQACGTGKLGVCSAGTTACTNGAIACNQNVQPHAETCNGLDDDCDGVVDNGNPGGNQACSTGKLGVCSAGTTACTGGSIACNQNVQPSAEVCDGALDENCNGVVDEGCNCVNGHTQPCYTGPAGTQGVGACHQGTQTCVAGSYGACVGQVLPSTETCDGIDNNCNGQVDEGLGTVSCGVGQCGRTVAACVGGHANTCVPGAPQPETCDGLDNDCDGVVDNGNPGGNQVCATGLLGVCSAGTTACVAGALQCNQNVGASAETCDGLDNDCDGVVDNGNPGGGLSCGTGQLGVCAAGTTACTAGAIACNRNTAPSPEMCDGLDNDCDGVVDNGNPGGGLSCSTGKLGVCAAGTTSCTSGAVACNQNVQPSTEVCDGLDNNCNGLVDDSAVNALTWYRDADGDGYGDINVSVKGCNQPAGYVNNPDDCNDGDPKIHPGNGTCGGLSAFALVSGGASMSSASYSAVITLGQSPGGNGTAASANYKLHGGLVGATQGP